MPSVGSVSGPSAYWPQPPTHGPATGGPARAFFCQTCRLSCSGPEPWRQHLESGRHMKLEADLRERMGTQPAVPVGASSPASGSSSVLYATDSIALSSDLRPPGAAFFCEACQLGCTGPAPWREHTRSAKHLKKVSLQERAVSNGFTSSQPPSRPGSALSVEDVLRSPGSPAAAISSPPLPVPAVMENSFYCDVCRLGCSGPEPWKQHVQSAKHMKKKRQTEMMVSLSALGSTYDGVSTAAALTGQTSPSPAGYRSAAVAADYVPPPPAFSTPASDAGRPFNCDARRIHCSGQESLTQHIQSAKDLKLTSQHGGEPSAAAQTAAGGVSCSSTVLTKPDPDGPPPQSGPAGWRAPSPGGRSEPSDRPSPTRPPSVPAYAERSGPPAAASPSLSAGAAGWGWALQLPAGSPRTDRASPQLGRHGEADVSGAASDAVSGRLPPVSASLVDSSQFRCDICQLTCTGPESLQQHLRGGKHRKMADRRLGAHPRFSSTDTPDGSFGRVLTPTPTPLLTPARSTLAEVAPAAADGPPPGVCADSVCAPDLEPEPGPGAAGASQLSAVCRSIRIGSHLHDLLDRKDGISREHTAAADQLLRQLHVEGLVAFLEDMPLIRHNQPFSLTRC